MARTTTDARHRWIAWGTFNLPRRSVISPVLEIRSDFRTRHSARVHAGEVVTAADTLIDEMITRPGRQTSRLCAQSTWELRLK
jgi:hypothetical protein